MTAITVCHRAPFLKAGGHAYKSAQLGRRGTTMAPDDSGLNFPGTRPDFWHARLAAFRLVGAVLSLMGNFPDKPTKFFRPNVEES